MALGKANEGQLIPVYSTDDVRKWVDGGADFLSSFMDVVVILMIVIGFLVCMLGIIQLMKAQREEQGTMAGGSRSETGYAIWKIIGGGLLGSLTTIYLFTVRVISV